MIWVSDTIVIVSEWFDRGSRSNLRKYYHLLHPSRHIHRNKWRQRKFEMLTARYSHKSNLCSVGELRFETPPPPRSSSSHRPLLSFSSCSFSSFSFSPLFPPPCPHLVLNCYYIKVYSLRREDRNDVRSDLLLNKFFKKYRYANHERWGKRNLSTL